MSMPSDPTPFSGRLSDGHTAGSIPVTVRLEEAGVEIIPLGERRTALVWPYAELQSSVPLTADAPDVLLSLKPAGAQALFVSDPGFSRALLPRARGLAPLHRRLAGLKPGIAAVALVAALIGGTRFFDLHPSQAIARLLPPQSREAMGRSVVAQLTGHMRRCETDSGRAALDRLTHRLAAAASNPPVGVRVVMIDWGLVNAFAAPGGQIILTRGLIQRASSPDEVAGVLAHEIGHTVELHPEAGLVRAMGLAAAAQLVFAGTTGTATNIGLLLTQLRYTRVAEREADVHALRTLKNAAVSAKGFGDFFERLDPQPAHPRTDEDKKNGTGGSKSLGSRIFNSEILRTHPLTGERVAMVRAQPAYAATPALSDEDWRSLREMCGQDSAPRPGLVKPARPMPPAPVPRQTSKSPVANADRDIAEATQTLQTNPNDVAALQRRARAYTIKGQHPEALADYVRATDLKPSDSSLLTGRGGAHYSLRQYELALVAYDEALRADAGNFTALNARGNTNRALKRYDEALADFDHTIRIRPDFVFAFYNRGLTNADLGRLADAERDFTAAIGIDKDYAGAYTQRGLLHLKAGARTEAITDFRAALAAPAAKYESGPWAHRTARDRLHSLGVEVP